MSLWTPPDAIARPRASLPAGNIKLGDGRWANRGKDTIVGEFRLAWWKTKDGLRISGGVEPSRAWGELLHLCMSRADRDPSWADICAVKDGFYGDRDAMIVLPREYDYVNLHPHAFHLWETPEAWGMQ